MTPPKRVVESGPSALNEVATREHTITIHKHIHGVSFKKHASQALREIQKYSMKEIGPPDVHIDIKLNKVASTRGITHVTYSSIQVRLFRNRNEDEDSPNKLYTLVTYLSVTTFETPQRVNVGEN
ncbi:60S ribosomal protein L31-like [Alexandromys fortis]|uniref:60S ribosomal protein L31-like n=1 Tax=Alexandromys fortis TaxID=100897 RepID=UPI002152EDF0|nr:60S ribosomal protein L31-like [Microtus fortis]